MGFEKGHMPWNTGLRKKTDTRLSNFTGRKKGHDAWNKGLTKENSISLMKISDSLKKHYKTGNAKCGFSKGHKLCIGRKNSELQRDTVRKYMLNGGGLKSRMCVKNNKPTRPELKMKEILDNNKINYTYQYKHNKFIFDFYLPEYKLIIECDGNYWHNYPSGTQKDEVKNKFAMDNNFYLYRVWESELKEDSKFCENVLMQTINNIKNQRCICNNDSCKMS